MKKNLLFLFIASIVSFLVMYIAAVISSSSYYNSNDLTQNTSFIYIEWIFQFAIAIIIFLALKIYYAIKELNDKLEDNNTNQN